MKLFYLNFLTTLSLKKDRQQKPTSPVTGPLRTTPAGVYRNMGEQGSHVTEMFDSGLRTPQGIILSICKRRGILKPLPTWLFGKLDVTEYSVTSGRNYFLGSEGWGLPCGRFRISNKEPRLNTRLLSLPRAPLRKRWGIRGIVCQGRCVQGEKNLSLIVEPFTAAPLLSSLMLKVKKASSSFCPDSKAYAV